MNFWHAAEVENKILWYFDVENKQMVEIHTQILNMHAFYTFSHVRGFFIYSVTARNNNNTINPFWFYYGRLNDTLLVKQSDSELVFLSVMERTKTALSHCLGWRKKGLSHPLFCWNFSFVLKYFTPHFNQLSFS